MTLDLRRTQGVRPKADGKRMGQACGWLAHRLQQANAQMCGGSPRI